ncbi:epoxide hydrolase [Mortierella alpina]|nr:epoxide hydrolase [Mortierella alpina]
MSNATDNTLEDSFVSVHEKTARGSSDAAATFPTPKQEDVDEDGGGDDEEFEQDTDDEDPACPQRIELSAIRSNLIPTLQARLARASYPQQLEGAGWAYGTESNILKMLTREWLHNYDWEKELGHLNRDYEHWKCRVNGLDIHYVRHDPWAELVEDPVTGEVLEGPFTGKTTVNENGQIIMPLLLLHGWPGTWYEFGKVIQLLKKRGRFQIIVPSLPGFGWSQAPYEKRFGLRAIAKTFHELMLHLGYNHYVVQGGDWGSVIARTMAMLYPENCLAIHVNMLPCLPPRPWTRPFGFAKAIAGFVMPSVVYRSNPREHASIVGLKEYAEQESGYFAIQSTRPQTLGYALHDSPVGLLSWLTEKYLGWADLDPSQPETWPFTKTELLTQIMIYHSTETITSSMRIYYEVRATKDTQWLIRRPLPKSVLVGVGVWHKELFMVPRAWAEDWMSIVSWHEFPKGGHFAAFERPVEFEKEISDFFTNDLILDLFTAKRHGFKV